MSEKFTLPTKILPLAHVCKNTFKSAKLNLQMYISDIFSKVHPGRRCLQDQGEGLETLRRPRGAGHLHQAKTVASSSRRRGLVG